VLERFSGGDAEAIRITTRNGSSTVLGLSWDTDNSKNHVVETTDSKLDWPGFYRVFEDLNTHE